MKKYDFKFRKKLVQKYLNGEGGYEALVAPYSSLRSNTLQRWVALYQAFGEESLKNDEKSTAYSVQFKLHALRLYQTTDMSQREVALELGMRSRTLIGQWQRRYDAKGIEGLSRTRSSPDIVNREDIQYEFQKLSREELEKKYLYSEIENAYLKQLRRLQEEATKTNKSQK